MDCEQIKHLLPAYQEDALTPRERDQVKAHLSMCRVCQREDQLLLSTWQALGVLEPIEPSSDFRARFWTKVRNEEASASPWWARILAPKLIPATCGVALWLFGVSTGVLLFDSKSSQRHHLSTEAIGLIAETYPPGSFSQLILGERHAH